MYRKLVAAGVVIVACAACGGGAAKDAGGDMAKSENRPAGQSAGPVNVHPCSLLTEAEIAAQVDLTLEQNQRKGLHDRGAVHRITSTEDMGGMFPACTYTWRSVDPTGEQWGTGTFNLYVMSASQLKGLEGMSRPKTGRRADPIPGVGDEAFYVEHAPSARVGDLGVSVADFPETHEGEGGVELLKAAVGRLR